MIRNKPMTSLIQQKPRKMLKLDLINQKCYNQFEGNSDMEDQAYRGQKQTNHDDQTYHKEPKGNDEKHLPIDKEINENQKIFKLISTDHLKFRKVNDPIKTKTPQQPQHSVVKSIKQQQSNLPQVKFEEGTQPPTIKNQEDAPKQKQEIPIKKQDIQVQKEKKIANKQKVKVPDPSSNWKKFLQQSKPAHNFGNKDQNNAKVSSQNTTNASMTQQSSKFVAMDCEFVKCGESDELARISIVSQNGKTLYDTYIKPSEKVTDFLTEITGITYSHIKNAPKWSEQVAKVKKILMGKMLVGHTLHKDLQVTKLTGWKGISKNIDIAEFSQYRQKGGSKNVSLKRMALSFLNRNIQSGWHSSVQDAVATMDLFKLNKKKILKQLKLI